MADPVAKSDHLVQTATVDPLDLGLPADTDLNDVSTALEDVLGEADSTKLVWRPQTTTELDLEGIVRIRQLHAEASAGAMRGERGNAHIGILGLAVGQHRARHLLHDLAHDWIVDT